MENAHPFVSGGSTKERHAYLMLLAAELHKNGLIYSGWRLFMARVLMQRLKLPDSDFNFIYSCISSLPTALQIRDAYWGKFKDQLVTNRSNGPRVKKSNGSKVNTSPGPVIEAKYNEAINGLAEGKRTRHSLADSMNLPLQIVDSVLFQYPKLAKLLDDGETATRFKDYFARKE